MKLFVSSLLLLFLLHLTSYAQWELNSGITTELTSSSNSIYCPSTITQGWACGVNGTVIKSITTSGQWLNVSGNGIPSNVTLDNICGLDTLTAFTAGHLNANTWVWKTTNGGANWIQVFTQPNGRINAVWMRNYSQGFMEGNPVGGRWSLWKTTNGGINWDSSGLYLQQSGNEMGFPNSFCMSMVNVYPYSDTSKIWFGTNNYRIYYSDDYGVNWDYNLTVPEQNIYSIMWRYGVLYTGGSNYLLHSTNNSGWELDTIEGTGPIRGITCVVWPFYLIRGNKVYTYYGNWIPVYTAPAGTYTFLDNRGYGNWVEHYAVRENGGITMFREGEGVQKNSSEIPNGFKLSQNYPNPFNPKSNIKFQIGKTSDVKLIVFDVLGREISTLVNEQLQPGTYETEWDASRYSSGIYFYRIVTEEFIDTKRMVLIK